MNTQNNERDKLVRLLAATSQKGGGSHEIQTHLENRFRDPKVCEAVIDYAFTLAQFQPKLEDWAACGGNKPFSFSGKTDAQPKRGDWEEYGGDEPFTHQANQKTC